VKKSCSLLKSGDIALYEVIEFHRRFSAADRPPACIREG
jgi:hypothetical protein